MAEWNQLFDARLDVRPPVSGEQLGEIPAKRGVVLLGAEGAEPIVMITAADMRARTRARLGEPCEMGVSKRSRIPNLREVTRVIFHKRCESHFETDWWFLEISRVIWPKRYAKMLGWKPPWFVHLHTLDAYPHLARSRKVFERAGRYIGPFASARDAERFIKDVQDAFDLCRSITCLRRAPNGPRCPYAEMDRCVSPADGTISMDEYRRILCGAVDFAAGQREELRRGVEAEMARAAKAMEFEAAAGYKNRLVRLNRLESDAYRFAAPAEQFAFVLVQRGAGRREVRVFLVYRGAIEFGGALEFPLREGQLSAVVESMRRLTATRPPADICSRLRMGLVTRTLISSPGRRGVVLPWGEGCTVRRLAEAIETNRRILGLPPEKKSKEKVG